MSSSSRSIAAARQKRAGEQSQQSNTSRPITSISSSSSFAPQYQQQPRGGQNIPVGGKNGRVSQSRGQDVNYQSSQQQQQQQSTKISVSNAVGLITLRLGKLEQMINELHFEEGGMNSNNNGGIDIPSNMKLVSDEVFENIVNRINLLESKLLNSKTMETHIEKLEREVKEMKGVITNTHNVLSNFVNETNDKFTDVENALALIEENAQINLEIRDETASYSDNVEVNETGETIETTNENVVLEYNENVENVENIETNENSQN